MDDVWAVLYGRLRPTIAHSEMLVARSRMLATAHALVADRRAMLRRCAWCGRIHVAGRWVAVEELPVVARSILDSRATHGICTSCLRRLEAEGRSRRDAPAAPPPP